MVHTRFHTENHKIKNFDFQQRAENLKALGSETWDVLVVGGGIVGAGIAWNCASRGLKVALVERADFACGTSSRSSKLVHGGIRYLAQGHLGLVREALTERTFWLKTAPHLVRPQRFIFPVYKDSPHSLWQLQIGFSLYDILSFGGREHRHHRYNARETLNRIGILKEEGLRGSIEYMDAVMDDDRMTIEILRTASMVGASPVNYVEALRFREEGDLAYVEVEDKKTGHKFEVKSKLVIGALGPWSDIWASSQLPHWGDKLRLTKGVHLVFPSEKLPTRKSLVIPAPENRIVFVIPRDHFTIVGTTDTDYEGRPEDVKVEVADIDYILNLVGEYLPGAPLKERDIHKAYVGLRPLISGSANTTTKTSREHSVLATQSSRLSLIAGGKYTTFRCMAEDAVRIAFSRIGTSLPSVRWYIPKHWGADRSDTTRIENHTSFLRDSVANSSDREIRYLLKDYGLEAPALVDRAKDFLNRTPTVAESILLHALQNGMCLTLRDFWLRRGPYYYRESDSGLNHLESLLEIWKKFHPEELWPKEAEISLLKADIVKAHYDGE